MGHLDYDDYYDITAGFVYTMMDYPPFNRDECAICWEIGDAVGGIQEGMVGLEVSRAMWLDYRQIFQLDFFDLWNRLMFVYIMFSAVFINVDTIFNLI